MVNTPEVVAGIIDNIRRFFQVVNEHSKRAERETGLTGPQLWAIKMIAESAPIKPSELARRMYLHPATVVGLIDRLERKLLVTRTRSNEDRRVVEISLTEQGRELLALAPEVPQGYLVRGLENLTDKKLLKVAEGVEELVKILGAEEIPPQLILSSEINLPRKRRSQL
ncbi:MarR family winged helix-turn-helix transcriptional regulator [Geobacter argillaceus]|jgi:DNA-binding MarR family transcriptional regulator|uniref:DNA-binding MarR family transcriptional regulator n=1 Tax=Geobacter argillaceus TaxID=345631 RepID=A0A562WUC2_9BACT|nr:MarR family transcriptional regulator [Geobacter argillaceus]TWJ33612.1 DNA-binding MarR family transcriptional regulator [Geobacter argillaceus]